MTFKIVYLNCRGVNNKLGEIKNIIYSLELDMLLLSETKIKKFEPRFANYSVSWLHRADRNGGGLGTVSHKDLNFQSLQVDVFPGGGLECQLTKVFVAADKNIMILNVYNPCKDISVEEFKHYISQLGDSFIIMGDFNAHCSTLDPADDRSNRTGRNIEEILQNDNICLLNPTGFYTYISPLNGRKSCLDLCLCSPDLLQYLEIKRGKDIGSDHLPIIVKSNFEIEKQMLLNYGKWILSDETIQRFSNNLPKSSIIKPCSVDSLAEDICSRITETANETFKISSPKRPKKLTLWWNDSCSEAVTNRRRCWRELERNPCEETLRGYRTASREAQKICRKAKRESFQNYVSSLEHNTPKKEVWRKIKAISRTYVPQSFPILDQDEIVIDMKQKANLFCSQFQSCATVGPHEMPNDLHETIQGAFNSLRDYNCDITEKEFLQAINRSRNTAPGRDGITQKLIKNLPQHTLDDLLYLYRQSYILGIFPAIWKVGLIVPILKPGKPAEKVTSYRPIALLPCLGKNLERIVQSRLEYLAEKEGLLRREQSGFRRGKGTTDTLTGVEGQIRESLATRSICLVVYIDLESAYDKVWPSGLIYKLAKYGIKGNILKWLASYLNGRKIQTNVNGHKSLEMEISAGLPQGAVLSPLLFNLMVSDFPREEEVKVFMYADDVTITYIHDDPIQAKEIMENYIRKLDTWCKQWGLVINPGKTYMQVFSNKRNVTIPLRIGNTLIKTKKEQRLLGVIFDSPKLTWTAHLKGLRAEIAKRTDMMKVISSTHWGAATKILRLFYIAYVRSKIEYGSVLYGSASEALLKKLDVCQNNCLRLILGARRTSPILSLQAEAHIPALSTRRSFQILKLGITALFRPNNDLLRGSFGFDIPQWMPMIFNSLKFKLKEELNSMRFTLPRQVGNYSPAGLPPWIDVGQYVIIHPVNEINTNQQLRELLSHDFVGYKQLFVDGSKIRNPITSTSSALFVPHQRRVHSWRLRPDISVVHSELYALRKALQFIQSEEQLCDYIIFSDCKAALSLISTSPRTYEMITHDIQSLLRILNESRKVILHWVRGHAHVDGNIVVDRAANRAHELDRIEIHGITREESISVLKAKYLELLENSWQTNMILTDTGRALGKVRDSLKQYIPLSGRSRREEVVIHRLRIGHVGLKHYLYRFQMTESELCENCGAVDSVEHFLLYCPRHDEEREEMRRRLLKYDVHSLSLKLLLAGDNQYRRNNRMILGETLRFLNKINYLSQL